MHIQINPSQCTGCGACVKACPKTAISYQDDAEGFPTPHIQGDLCIECGLCDKVCPANHMPETHGIQAAYAAQILDQVALQDSTSGGLFTVFSREVFRRGGVVYGCVWDKDYNAVITKAENEEEIKPMRGSKYVWSFAADTYPEIKQYLEAGRTVMFTGLPCQVAGLKNYLRKNYDNLYLIASFCAGAPSPLALHAYLKSITKDVPIDGLDLKFRDKEKHGVGAHITYQRKRGKADETHISNSYYYAFYSKVTVRRACYSCRFWYNEKVEDITIGDYWGVKKYHPDMDARSGISALLVNTDKGNQLLQSAKRHLELVPTEVSAIARSNNVVLDSKPRAFDIPDFRKEFFDAMNDMGWEYAEKKYLRDKKRFVLWLKITKPAQVLKKIRGGVFEDKVIPEYFISDFSKLKLIKFINIDQTENAAA